MIISHKYKYIFIRTKKTAGTSLEIALSKYCGPKDVITTIHPADEEKRQKLGYPGPQNYKANRSFVCKILERLKLYRRTQVRDFKEHRTAEQIRANVSPEVWNSYFKFCIERNPYDKAISRYYWKTKKDDPRPPISQFLADSEPEALSNWQIYAIDNEIAVDFVIRYETLNDDLALLVGKLKLPGELQLPKAKVDTRKDRRHYSQVLSEADRARIEEVCANEISKLVYGWQSEVQEKPINSDASGG